jgi:ParB-like chromosome segregation protein Spo0J
LDEALKPEEAIEARLIENLQREDLDPLDEAEVYQALRGMSYSLAEIGRRLGKSRPYVSIRGSKRICDKNHLEIFVLINASAYIF